MRHLLLHLRTRQDDLVSIDDNDEVTHIHMWREGRLVLTSQQGRSVARQSTQDNILGIDDIPLTRLIARLRTISSHSSTHFPSIGIYSIKQPKGDTPPVDKGMRLPGGGGRGQKKGLNSKNKRTHPGFRPKEHEVGLPRGH
jgi:hypothetical protein